MRERPLRPLPPEAVTTRSLRLMAFAVLARALADCADRDSVDEEERRTARQALAWFQAPEEDGPFAFRVVCGMLEMRAHWLQRLARTITPEEARRLFCHLEQAGPA